MQSYSYASMPVNVVSPSYKLDSFYQLPGEVASLYPAYNPYPGHPSYATPRPLQHELTITPHTTPVRRRSSATYHPYHVAQHETTRSPTRSRFPNPGPITVVQNVVDIRDAAPISPTRAQRLQTLLTPDRFNRNKNRNVPSEAEVESLSQLSNAHANAHVKPTPMSIQRGMPTDHSLVPQGLFREPKCSEIYFFRHTPISFNLKNLAKGAGAGVKAGDLLGCAPPKLEGNDDFVLKDLKEREFRVAILWPGYKTFEKRVKTYSPQNELRTRSFIALRLAIMLQDFRNNIKDQKWEVEPGQEHWKLSTEPKDGGIDIEDLTITQMVHCGGSHWQMELWAPAL